MAAPNILVIVVDGLRASALGAYGNTTFPTPTFDRLAADSYLFDWCYASSVNLESIYRDLWFVNTDPLPRHLRSSGYDTTLVSDEPSVLSFAGAGEFDHCLQLDDKAARRETSEHRASDVFHTSLARLFTSAAEVVSATRAPRIVWVHSRGMYGPWDAPVELQESMLDEHDPPPVTQTSAPDFVLTADADPDAAFRYACAYAAQAMVLDECCGSLLDAVDSGRNGEWLVALIGARGYPLGEHDRVGGVDSRLYGEQLHVPWLIRLPEKKGRLSRVARITSHAELGRLLSESLPDASSPALVDIVRAPLKQAHIATSIDGHRAIRTAEWGLLQKLDSHREPVTSELFVRPDDRWEANDVAKLCDEEVEQLSKTFSSMGADEMG